MEQHNQKPMTDKEILKAFHRYRKAELECSVVRPVFTLKKELALLIAGSIVLSTVMIVSVHFHNCFSGVQLAAILTAAVVLFIRSQSKNLLLLLIFLYQRFAPASVRSVCLFTPSCSEYMRLSVLKYGVCRGCVKGLRRLRKCHPPNGGIDEP